MAMPGFTAGASLYKTDRQYRMVKVLGAPVDGWEALVQPAQVPTLRLQPVPTFPNITNVGTILKPILTRGIVGTQPLPFRCDSLACECSGDADCNDMFSTDACGTNATCEDLPGGGVRCVCLRHPK